MEIAFQTQCLQNLREILQVEGIFIFGEDSAHPCYFYAICEVCQFFGVIFLYNSGNGGGVSVSWFDTVVYSAEARWAWKMVSFLESGRLLPWRDFLRRSGDLLSRKRYVPSRYIRAWGLSDPTSASPALVLRGRYRLRRPGGARWRPAGPGGGWGASYLLTVMFSTKRNLTGSSCNGGVLGKSKARTAAARAMEINGAVEAEGRQCDSTLTAEGILEGWIWGGLSRQPHIPESTVCGVRFQGDSSRFGSHAGSGAGGCRASGDETYRVPRGESILESRRKQESALHPRPCGSPGMCPGSEASYGEGNGSRGTAPVDRPRR